MSKSKRRRELLPKWDMPSDPVKAVFWFMHWSLKVLVRFFWILIIAGVTYESLINGFIGGSVTLLVGLSVWLGLAIVLFLFNLGKSISRTVNEVSRMQQGLPSRRSPNTFVEPDIDNGRVVEGTIVTDLEAERRKRRRE